LSSYCIFLCQYHLVACVLVGYGCNGLWVLQHSISGKTHYLKNSICHDISCERVCQLILTATVLYLQMDDMSYANNLERVYTVTDWLIIMLAGFLIRPSGSTGSELGYVSQTDPQGKVPPWLVNKVTQIFAPKVRSSVQVTGVYILLHDMTQWCTFSKNYL